MASAALALLLVSACEPSDRNHQPPPEAKQTAVTAERVHWRLDHDQGAPVEGYLAYVSRSDGRLTMQLVSRQAVNLVLVMPEDGPDERPVDAAFLVLKRGGMCGLVLSEPPFHVRFEGGEGSEGEWLRGSYAGELGCEDFSPASVRGTFQVKNAGADR